MALFKRKKNTEEEKKAEEKPVEKKTDSVEQAVKKDDAVKTGGTEKEKTTGVKKSAAAKSMKDLYSGSGKAPVKTTDKEGKSVKQIKKFGYADRIIIKPLVTEKAANLGMLNQYVFEAAPKANKIEIAKAINEIYGIMPKSVNIVKMKGKNLRYGRHTGKRRDWKKAIITLPQGKTINIYEGV